MPLPAFGVLRAVSLSNGSRLRAEKFQQISLSCLLLTVCAADARQAVAILADAVRKVASK